MDPFFLEQRLQEGSPDLHKRLNDSIFVLRTMLQKFLIRFPDFTDHSILHSMDVAEFCNSIIGYDQVQKLLPEECYVLLMACNAGHMNPALQRADGAQQSDDITMLCLRYNGPAEN